MTLIYELMAATFLLLVAGHALADYPLQGDYLSKMKNPYLNNARAGEQNSSHWSLFMASHAAIHAGMVLAITMSPVLFILEFVAHFSIDTLKCLGRIRFLTDQFLHILCKVVWVLYYAHTKGAF